MSGKTETEARYQEIIRKLEETLQTTRNELSYMASTLIEERQLYDRTREYANTIDQENLFLKQKIKDFECEAEQSEARTHERTYSSSYSDPYPYSYSSSSTMPPMSPVSVSVSPRIHPQPQPQPQQYQCSPAMATCDGLFEPSPSHFRTNNQEGNIRKDS
jgi:hypothetical protein